MANQNELKIRPMALTRRDLQLFIMLKVFFITLLMKSRSRKIHFHLQTLSQILVIYSQILETGLALGKKMKMVMNLVEMRALTAKIRPIALRGAELSFQIGPRASRHEFKRKRGTKNLITFLKKSEKYFLIIKSTFQKQKSGSL